jgi:hypothetical protein
MMKRFLLNGAAFLSISVNVFFLTCTAAFAQTTDGSITIQTTDITKALVPGTHLVLTDVETNITREGTTLKSGTYTFGALPPATYRLTVEHVGFSSLAYDTIVVQAGIATPLNITLKVGSDTQKVDVSAVSVPVIETSSNTLSTSINLEEVNNLPLASRSVLGLQALAPGYASINGNIAAGTFNGTPQAAYQANLDGINSTSDRGKAGGGSNSAVTLRVENIQEFTVQSGELNPSQGGGQSAAQTLFVTKRGTNKFHGSLFENHQEDAFNAAPWNYGFQAAGARLHKPHVLINDFGGSLGGPIFRDKLFFFVNFTARVNPNGVVLQTVLPTLAAVQGNYSYQNASGGISTVNVLQGAGAAGLDSKINGGIAFQEALNEGVYKYGTFTQTPTQLNVRTLNYLVPSKQTVFYPSGRLDYSVNSKLNVNLSGNMTRSTNDGIYQDPLPGPFQIKTTGSYSKNYVLALGVDYTVTPTIVNQFKAGFLYTHTINSPQAVGFDVGSQGALGYPFQGISSGNFSITPQGNYYPYLQGNDDVSWQKGSHTIKFGGNFWHQQDHFYNPAIGYANINVGLSSLDPVYNTISAIAPTSGPNTPANTSGAQGDVTAMYGWLNGRVTSATSSYPVDPKTGKFPGPGSYFLDEASMGGGFYLQDTWRVMPSLTLNYGLRWDMVADMHDLKLGYTGPSAVDLFGSSGYLNIFQPGANSGPANPQYTTTNHKYNSSLVLPQPQIGFAWNPTGNETFMGKLLGAGKTVIRGSYTLKNYTEGGQSFWQAASNSGYNFFNSNSLTASNTVGPQYFAPGSIKLATPAASCTSYVTNCVNQATEATTLPPLYQSPSTYQATIAQSSVFFQGGGAPAAIDPNIKQPYVESYTFGIQRQINHSSAFEIRYVGNRSIHDWIAYNYNEINSLNNGFLQEFTAAQQNLAINTAAGLTNDFSNHGSGPAMPILTAAFGGGSSASFKNASYVTFLKNGSLGGLAGTVANNQTFFCNVVSKAFGPCSTVASAPLSSTYPSNLFQVNPYLEGKQAALTSSKGSSNYNSLQMEFRQKVAHGLDLNVNYTYGKTLGNSSNQASGSIGNTANIITLHNLHYNYQPISYDIRNALKLSGTYALPFGKNKAFLSNGRMMNYVVGGWTAGAIMIYQSGAPIALTGGLSSTINSASDGGVTFVGGTTAHDIQSSVGVRRAAPGASFVNLIDPKFQSTVNGNANKSYVVPNTTPGVEGNLPFIYGPKWNNFDLAATKDLPIFEAIHINLQAIFLNAFNHPEWIGGGFNTQSTTFGTTGTQAQAPRRIELRGNITF